MMDFLLFLGQGIRWTSQAAIELPLHPEPRRVAPGPARLAEVGLGLCLPFCVGTNGDPQGDISKSSPTRACV